MYKHFFKRIIDLLISAIALIILSPFIVFITITLFILNKKNVFFFQKRPGLKEKLFTIIKFKTMNDKKDIHGNLLPDSERLTAIGSFIRKTSLDVIFHFYWI